MAIQYPSPPLSATLPANLQCFSLACQLLLGLRGRGSPEHIELREVMRKRLEVMRGLLASGTRPGDFW